jgi:hypothetical protein
MGAGRNMDIRILELFPNEQFWVKKAEEFKGRLLFVTLDS